MGKELSSYHWTDTPTYRNPHLSLRKTLSYLALYKETYQESQSDICLSMVIGRLQSNGVEN